MLRHWTQDYDDPESECVGLECLEPPDGLWECFVDAGSLLAVAAKNREGLQQRGTFERALLRAWCAMLGTTHEWDPQWIEKLFLVHADRGRLRAEADPLPVGEMFQVYRGVAGLGEHRREQGLAWTLDLSVALRFAECGLTMGLADPLVLEGRVRRENVLAYTSWRKESEMICPEVAIVERHAVSTRSL